MKEIVDQVRNIHAVGRNYVKHIQELNNAIPTEPVLFSKSPSCLATGTEVRFPHQLGDIHHELELVVRIGEPLEMGCYSHLNCISHIGLGIDFTARSKQTSLKQEGLPWHLGKNFNDGCFISHMRPYTQQLDNPIHFQLAVNGEIRQDGDSSHMIYPLHDLLAFINRTIPLQAGDLIFTGTPEGVAPVNHGDQISITCHQLDIQHTLTVHVSQPK